MKTYRGECNRAAGQLIDKPDESGRWPTHADTVPRGNRREPVMKKYAICAALATKLNKSSAGNIIKYLKRIPQQEFSVFVIKDALNRNKDLKQVPAVREWIMSSAKQLML